MASAHKVAALTLATQRDEVEVAEIDQVSELHPVLDRHILMLVVRKFSRGSVNRAAGNRTSRTRHGRWRAGSGRAAKMVRMFMFVRLNGAASKTKRPSWRDLLSFSPPVACRSEMSFAVALVGTPSNEQPQGERIRREAVE